MSLFQIDSADDIGSIDLSLLPAFSSYEGISFVDRSEREFLLRSALADCISMGGVCIAAIAHGFVEAICAVHVLDWDSRHFEVPMGKLIIASIGELPGSCLDLVVSTALSAARKISAIRHLSAEVCSKDTASLAALARCGFEVIDKKRFFYSERPPEARVKLLSMVNSYHVSYEEDVMAIIRETSFPGRFSKDHYLCANKTKSMYESWARNALAESSDNAYVFVRRGEIHGGGFSQVRSVDFNGMRREFADGGLYFSTAQGVGGYLPVSYINMKNSVERYGLIRTAVSAGNDAAIKVLCYLGAKSSSDFLSLRAWISGCSS